MKTSQRNQTNSFLQSSTLSGLDDSSAPLLGPSSEEQSENLELGSNSLPPNADYEGPRTRTSSKSFGGDGLDPKYNGDLYSQTPGVDSLYLGRSSSTTHYVEKNNNRFALSFSCCTTMNQCLQYASANCLKPSREASNKFLKGAAYYTYKGVSYAEAITNENIDVLRWYSSIVVLEFSFALFYEIYKLSSDYEQGKEDYNNEPAQNAISPSNATLPSNVKSIPIDTGDLNAAWDEVIDSAMNDWQDSTFTIDGTPPAPIDSALIVILPFMAAGACYKWGLSIPTLPYLENAPIHLLEPGNTKVTTSIGLIPALVIGFLYLPPMEFNVLTSILVFTAAGILALRALLALYNVVAEKLNRKDMVVRLGSTQAVSPEESSITTTASKAIQLSIPMQIAFFIGAGGYIADKYIDNYFDAYDVMKQALLPVYGPVLAPQYIRLCIEYAFQIFNDKFWHDIYSVNEATAIGVIFLPTIVIFGAIFVAKALKSLAERKLTPEQIQTIRAEVINFTNKHFRHGATTPPSAKEIEFAFMSADCYSLKLTIETLEQEISDKQVVLDGPNLQGDTPEAIQRREEIQKEIKMLNAKLKAKLADLEQNQQAIRAMLASQRSTGDIENQYVTTVSPFHGDQKFSSGDSDSSSSTTGSRNTRRKGNKLPYGTSSMFSDTPDSVIDIGLISQPVDGDGNCLFASLAAAEGKGKNAAKMRADIVNHMRNNSAQFTDQALDGDRNNYLGKMAQSSTWGGYTEVVAAAEIMEIKIVIFHGNGNPISVEPTSEQARDAAKSKSTIYLSWNGTHYEYFNIAPGENSANIENHIAAITTQKDGEPRTYLTFSQANNSFTLLNQEELDRAQAQARSKYQAIIHESIDEIANQNQAVRQFTSYSPDEADKTIEQQLNALLEQARALQNQGPVTDSSSSNDEITGTLVKLAQCATEALSLVSIAEMLVIEYLSDKISVLLKHPFTWKQTNCLDEARDIFDNADLGQIEKKLALTNILRTALGETKFADKLLTAQRDLSAIKTHAKQSDNNALKTESLEKITELNAIIEEPEQTIEQREERLTPITTWIATVSAEAIKLLLAEARTLAKDDVALNDKINNLESSNDTAAKIAGLGFLIAKNSLTTENGEAVLNLINHERMKNIARSVYTANNQRSASTEAKYSRGSVKFAAAQGTVSRETKQQQFTQFLLDLSRALNDDLGRKTIPPQEAFIVYQLIMECKQGEENSAVLTGFAIEHHDNIIQQFTGGFYHLDDFQLNHARNLADKRKAPEEKTSTIGSSSNLYQEPRSNSSDNSYLSTPERKSLGGPGSHN